MTDKTDKNIKIKICGLSAESEAEYLNLCHVDYAGFVLFFPKSRRNTDIETAKRIFERLDPAIKKVAVTVSPTLWQAREIEEAGFDYIQVHGTLLPEIMTECGIKIIRAFNVDNMDTVKEYEDNPRIAGYVFDAARPGSGETFDWALLDRISCKKPFLLAGGLNAENVRAALEYVSPYGVDVSSSVEKPEGGKDKDKIADFVSACREV